MAAGARLPGSTGDHGGKRTRFSAAHFRWMTLYQRSSSATGTTVLLRTRGPAGATNGPAGEPPGEHWGRQCQAGGQELWASQAEWYRLRVLQSAHQCRGGQRKGCHRQIITTKSFNTSAHRRRPKRRHTMVTQNHCVPSFLLRVPVFREERYLQSRIWWP